MPWMECSMVSQREELVKLAVVEGANVAELCRRFGVSRKTGYKWLSRYRQAGTVGLANRSRRPRSSPGRTMKLREQAVLAVRSQHPAWGGRKIRRVLQDRGQVNVPAASTITAILHRHGLVDAAESSKHKPFRRFEHPRPNDLWQVDFKGHFALDRGRCHPLTVLDDHSRYCVGLQACANERGPTVQERLTAMFRRYGLPRRMLMDNGSPWGNEAGYPWTQLTVWLLRLEVGVSHGRPYHPQTQGKDERFHRTLKVELLSRRYQKDLETCQVSFDDWRMTYNMHRPHEALGMATPASRYEVSCRVFPEVLPAIEYGPGDIVRRVRDGGRMKYQNVVYRVGKSFTGYYVALRSTEQDGILEVYFSRQRIAWLDVRTDASGRANGTRQGVGDGGVTGEADAAFACQAFARYARSGPARGEASGSRGNA